MLIVAFVSSNAISFRITPYQVWIYDIANGPCGRGRDYSRYVNHIINADASVWYYYATTGEYYFIGGGTKKIQYQFKIG